MPSKIEEAEEPRYTYIEWKTLEQRKQEYESNKRKYFIKQKLGGIVLIIAGVIVPVLTDIDVTFLLCIALPLGLYLLITKRHAMVF